MQSCAALLLLLPAVIMACGPHGEEIRIHDTGLYSAPAYPAYSGFYGGNYCAMACSSGMQTWCGTTQTGAIGSACAAFKQWCPSGCSGIAASPLLATPLWGRQQKA